MDEDEEEEDAEEDEEMDDEEDVNDVFNKDLGKKQFGDTKHYCPVMLKEKGTYRVLYQTMRQNLGSISLSHAGLIRHL